MTQWYYADDARHRHGPHSAEELRAHYRQRRIRRDSLVWREGLSEWLPLERVAGEVDLDSVVPDASLPPPMPPAGGAAPMYATRPVAAKAKKQGMSGCLIALLICAGLAIPLMGILAAIALPAYQDYTVRAKVAQAMFVAEPLKAAVVTHLASDATCPDDDDNALAAIRQQIEQNPYVAAVRAGTLQGGNCAFEITLRGVGTQADGKTLLFEAQRNGEQIAWDCRGGDLPARHRPTQCRTME